MPTLSALDAEFVRRLVRDRAAIELGRDKDYLIETRLALLGAASRPAVPASELIARARSGHAGADTAIVEAITTHETSFFRDRALFDLLASDLVPGLMQRRSVARTLTLWSAACSTGQEPYTLAILLRERLPALADWTVRIIATDLSAKVLERARAGRFTQLEVQRGLSATQLLQHFDRDGGHWVAKPALRRGIEWRQLNLASPWHLGLRPDLVLLRNVLIYFDPAARRSVLDRMRHTLASDGALLLGAAETTQHIADGWTTVVRGRAAYFTVSP